jgi:hypothetical protein
MYGTMYGMNIFQLIYTIALLSIGFHKDLDWFHLRYILDVAALSGWQTVFTAVVIPNYFCTYILAGPLTLAVMVMLPMLGDSVYKNKLDTALATLPQCFDRKIRDVCTPVAWKIFIVLCVYLALTLGLNVRKSAPSTPWKICFRLSLCPWWLIIGFITPAVVVVVIETIMMFNDDAAFRPLLDPAEASWELGQIMTLVASVSGSALAFFSVFNINGMFSCEPVSEFS